MPKVAWFTAKGRHKIIDWDGAVLNKAKSLAKRKDAVLAIELILQVGKQSDWRSIPTAEHPHGKPKPGCVEPLKKFAAAAVKAGKVRLPSADFSTVFSARCQAPSFDPLKHRRDLPG